MARARAKIFGKLFKLFSHFLGFRRAFPGLSLASLENASMMRAAAGAASASRIVVIELSNQLLSGENSCWEMGMENGWVRSHAKWHTSLEIHAVSLSNVLRFSTRGILGIFCISVIYFRYKSY